MGDRIAELNRELAEEKVAYLLARKAMEAAEAEANSLRESRGRFEDEAKAARAELALRLGEIRADEERLRIAATRVGCDKWGCDAADHMADEILEAQAELERVKRDLRIKETEFQSRSSLLRESEARVAQLERLAWAAAHSGFDENECRALKEALARKED